MPPRSSATRLFHTIPPETNMVSETFPSECVGDSTKKCCAECGGLLPGEEFALAEHRRSHSRRKPQATSYLSGLNERLTARRHRA